MPGTSIITGDESIIYADNVSFDGTERGGKLTTDGQLLIGSTAAPHIRVGTLTSVGGSVTITTGNGTINLESSGGGGGGGITSVPTDSGVAAPLAGVLQIIGGTGIDTSGASNIVTIDVDPSELGVATSYGTDSGSATPAAGLLNLVGGTGGIDTVGVGNTVTFNFDVSEQPTIPTSVATDSGTATPAANSFSIVGGTGMDTTGAGSTVTIAFDVTEVATIATSYPTDSGTATPAANALTIAGGEGIDVSGSGATVTIAGEDASDTNKGIASFDSGDFTVTNGNVVLNGSGVGQTITGDAGGALSPSSGNWNIVGGNNGIDTSGAGSTLTLNFDITEQPTIPTSVATDSGTATPALNSFSIVGGEGIDVSGATSVVTIAGENASDSNKGIASFDSGDFTVTNGNVVLNGSGVGQTLTGDSGGALSPSSGNWNILGGPGVTVSGSGSTLTVNSVVFTDTTAATLASDNGYFATGAGTYTLPGSPAQGETVIIVCDVASGVIVDAPGAHFIRVGNVITSAGGTLTSTAIGDSLTLRYRSSGTTWFATSSMGTWTST